jgi:undecaprenyl-diphosphatase
MIIVGSIPAVLVGFFVSRFGVRESFEKSPVLIGFCFLITAALLKLTDYAREQGFEMRTAGLKKPLLVGCGQALSAALLGVSRSGSTVSTGLIAGFKRQDAVVFSFFLAIPAILGAMCMESLKLLKIVKGMTDYGTLHIDAVVAGCVAAFIMSLIAIKLLLVIVQMKKFSLFAYYMLLAAAATFVIAFIYR